MKITGTGDEIARYINETAVSRTNEAAEKPSTPTNAPPSSKGDEVVNLSETSKEVQMAKEAMGSEPDVRSEEVQAIKDRIEKGTYEINYDKTAEKMLKTFFDEMI